MKAQDGTEIAVGQRWRMQGGETAEVVCCKAPPPGAAPQDCVAVYLVRAHRVVTCDAEDFKQQLPDDLTVEDRKLLALQKETGSTTQLCCEALKRTAYNFKKAVWWLKTDSMRRAGWKDEARNIKALKRCGGDVGPATFLLATRDYKTSEIDQVSGLHQFTRCSREEAQQAFDAAGRDFAKAYCALKKQIEKGPRCA